MINNDIISKINSLDIPGLLKTAGYSPQEISRFLAGDLSVVGEKIAPPIPKIHLETFLKNWCEDFDINMCYYFLEKALLKEDFDDVFLPEYTRFFNRVYDKGQNFILKVNKNLDIVEESDLEVVLIEKDSHTFYFLKTPDEIKILAD